MLTARDRPVRLAAMLVELRALVATDLPLRGYPSTRAAGAEEVVRDVGRLLGHEGVPLRALPGAGEPPDRLHLALIEGWAEGHRARLWALAEQPDASAPAGCRPWRGISDNDGR